MLSCARKAVTVAGVTTMLTLANVSVAANDVFSAYVDSRGSIQLPPDFRLSMVHLGSWFVPDGEASGFHDVYTEQGTVEAYRRTGKFPDGATLVKELRSHKAGDYTTGKGVSHATDGLKQWFVMIKDTQGRYAGNPLWGDGWGWGLYRPDEPAKNIAVDYKKDCLGCHVPAKATDWIYTQAYPTLRAK